MTNELIKRLEDFIDASGVGISAIARKVGLHPVSIYRARKGDLKLSNGKLNQIDFYLRQFGF